MPNETELRAYTALEKAGEMALSRVPGSVRKSSAYQALLQAEILREKPKGGGFVLRVEDPASLSIYLNKQYPGRHYIASNTAAGNVHRYRNSKAGKATAASVVLLRGEHDITLNGAAFDLAVTTENYGCAACVQPAIATQAICIVENLSSFFRAEELLGPSWTFLHPYGRLGNNTFKSLACEKLLHFGDLDYTGLEEYLRLKEHFPNARLYCPNTIEHLWSTYSTPMKPGTQINRRIAKERHDVDVIRIRELIRRTNQFLEQQAFFIPETDRS